MVCSVLREREVWMPDKLDYSRSLVNYYLICLMEVVRARSMRIMLGGA